MQESITGRDFRDGQFCPTPDCPAKGQVGQGNIGAHSHRERRFIYHVCQQTFSERKGAVFIACRKNAVLITQVLTLLAHSCPAQAIVASFGLDERSVRLARQERRALLSRA